MGGSEERSRLPALLVLADGRLPVGGHAHSAGIEAAMLDGRVRDLDDVAAFVEGRIRTAGLADAALAAATALSLQRPGAEHRTLLSVLDAEADARLPVEALRVASRRLGRQLTRVAAGCWPAPVLVELADVHPDGAHQSVAFGAVGVAAGATPHDAAALVLHHAVTTPIQAAVKIAGLDPFGAAELTVRFGPTIAALADSALVAASGARSELPCATGPLVEIAAVHHDRRAGRLFAT